MLGWVRAGGREGKGGGDDVIMGEDGRLGTWEGNEEELEYELESLRGKVFSSKRMSLVMTTFPLGRRAS